VRRRDKDAARLDMMPSSKTRAHRSLVLFGKFSSQLENTREEERSPLGVGGSGNKTRLCRTGQGNGLPAEI
jgi:hypothetical protein